MRDLGKQSFSILSTILPCFLLISRLGTGAVLSIPDQALRSGDVAIGAISFSSEGQAISGLQFDIEWDAGIDVQTSVGALVGQSSKTLQQLASSGNRGVRCLIVGMNQNLIPDGEVLRVYLFAAPATAPGTLHLRISNAAAVSTDGQAVAIQSVAVNVQVQSGSGSLSLQPQAFLNAASFLTGPVSPGEIITVLGSGGVDSLLFNGVPAPVLYTGANQINAIVPFNLALTAPATVEVRRGQTAATLSVPVAPAAPAIFTLSASGTGPGAILNQDFTPNSSFSPAARDSVIMIYGTGFGMLDPAPADGQIAAGPALQVLPVSVTIGGIPAEVSYAGASPGLISGLTQINVRVPKTLPPDPVTPLSIRVGTASIPPGVTVAIQ